MLICPRAYRTSPASLNWRIATEQHARHTQEQQDISTGLQMTRDRSSDLARRSQQPLATSSRPRTANVPPVAHEAVILSTEGVSVSKARDAQHGSASELLADWRSAERDSVAAHEAASVAARAVTAAAAAEEAAVGAETAARDATDAAARAKEAAERARTAAGEAAEAAQRAAATTEDDQARADQTVAEADRAETEARDRFHEAQEEGFPKD